MSVLDSRILHDDDDEQIQSPSSVGNHSLTGSVETPAQVKKRIKSCIMCKPANDQCCKYIKPYQLTQ